LKVTATIADNVGAQSWFVERGRPVMSRVVERMDTFVRVANRPAPVVLGLLCDLRRSLEQLIAEGALLHQRLMSRRE
jgi:hypothetical protein